MRWLSKIVTVAVVVAVVAGAFLLIRTRVPKTHVGEDFYTYALFRDGSRLAVGSPVMIAGVRVGEISKLGIERGYARVDLTLENKVTIPNDSWITKRAESAFADNYIEIIPTGGDEGTPIASPLHSGEPLTHVVEGSSTDSVLRAIDRAMPKVDNAVTTVHDVMVDGRRWVNGPMVDRVKAAQGWLDEGSIETPLATADRFMTRFENGTTSAADAVAEAKPAVTRTLNRADEGIASAREKIASVKQGIVEGLTSAREGMDRVDDTIEGLHEMTTAIDEGSGADWKGQLGRLINDPEPGATITDVTQDARDGLDGYVALKSWLGVRFEVGAFAKVPRTYVTAELATKNDTFFLVELIKSNLGARPEDSLTDVVGSSSFGRRTVIDDSLRFTFQFGKRLGPLRFRGGYKESTPGVGTDLLMYRGRLKLSADAYGSFTTTPYIKLLGAFAVFRELYVVAGVSDVFNKPGYLNLAPGNTDIPTQFSSVRYGRDYFLGASLQFNDADLATLLRVYGSILASTLL